MTAMDLSNLGTEGWLEAISASQRGVIIELLQTGKTEEEISELWLNRIGPDANAGFGTAGSIMTYFSNFRIEMDAFICGDSRYANERAKVSSIWEKQGKSGLIALVAGCIATKIGLAAVVVSPAVALFFHMVTKMGVGAYCKTRGQA
jgi:hypothetical protein